ncbi:MAG: hypothetical protein Q4F70_03455 [Clostridia bacterium]|nr:hypothetical protein [Clostridia bacterium]
MLVGLVSIYGLFLFKESVRTAREAAWAADHPTEAVVTTKSPQMNKKKREETTEWAVRYDWELPTEEETEEETTAAPAVTTTQAATTTTTKAPAPTPTPEPADDPVTPPVDPTPPEPVEPETPPVEG